MRSAKKTTSIVIVLTIICLSLLTVASGNDLENFVKNPVGTVVSWAFEPTIDNAQAAGHKVVADGRAAAEQVIAEALQDTEELTDKKLDELSELINKSTNRLDEISRVTIQSANLSAQDAINEFRLRVEETTWLANNLLKKLLVAFLFGLVLVALIRFILDWAKEESKGKIKDRRPIAYGLGAAAILGVVLLIPPAQSLGDCINKDLLIDSNRSRYWTHHAKREFSESRAAALNLAETSGGGCEHGEEALWAFRKKKAELLTEIALNPATYLSDTRRIATQDAIFELIADVTDDQPDSEGTILGLPTIELSDLYAAGALLYWTGGRTRHDEAEAGIAAYRALEPLQEYLYVDDLIKEINPKFPLATVALSVLEKYKAQPLSDIELSIVGMPQDDWVFLDASSRYLAEDVREFVGQSSFAKKAMPLRYERYARYIEYFRENVVSAYVCMVHHNALAQPWKRRETKKPWSGGYGISQVTETAEQFDAKTHTTIRDRCARRIIALYEGDHGILVELESRDYNGTTVRIAALQGPHAIFERAKNLLDYNHKIARSFNADTYESEQMSIVNPQERAAYELGISGNTPVASLPVVDERELQRAITATLRAQQVNMVVWTAVPPQRSLTDVYSDSPALALVEELGDGDAGPSTRKFLGRAVERQLKANLKKFIEFEQNYTQLIEAYGDAFGGTLLHDPVQDEKFREAFRTVAEQGGGLGLFTCPNLSLACDPAVDWQGEYLAFPSFIHQIANNAGFAVDDVGLYNFTQTRLWPRR